MDDRVLKDEIRTLAGILGDVIQTIEGADTRSHLEEIRDLALARRAGEPEAEAALEKRIASLTESEIDSLIAGFSLFFDLANLAEDRHRVRVLRERERDRDPDPRAESIADAVQTLQQSGFSAEKMQALLDHLDIELVFTAHPTEAKRRSVREKIRDLREHMASLDDPDLLPAESRRLWRLVRGDLLSLWQTDLLRERRPTVLEEVNRALFFAGTLWETAPRLYADLRSALHRAYPDSEFTMPTFLRFGTWIGGDRDGHPGVTWRITAEAMRILRERALKGHLDQCRSIRRTLSLSDVKAPALGALRPAIDEAARRWPTTRDIIEPIDSRESCRRWLRIIQWRLEQTFNVRPFEAMPEGAYSAGAELRADLVRILEALDETPGGDVVDQRLRDWITQVDVFGFHLERMDVRQESSWHTEVLDEIFRAIGVADQYASLDETGRQAALADAMNRSAEIDAEALSENSRETLALFRLLADTVRTGGAQALGGAVISMTHQPSDVLAVLWLGRHAAAEADLPDARLPMPIIPLFETIEDLAHAPDTLNALLEHPLYREHVEDAGRQIVMVGYSDSTKDGGYFTAAWSLHRSQIELHRISMKHGVRLTIFHGRGGSLGRGGGPAARSMRSLPPQSVDGAIRITEQGEVLSERYDDPDIAHRHLEQMTWATLLVSAGTGAAPDPEWLELMEALSTEARKAYRELVDGDGFIEYFEEATPIAEIERLPIGSRPARRQGARTLTGLRAIPWVFSWTQSRHMLPAWYGLGAGVERLEAARPGSIERLREIYKRWSFFEGTIDNAELALAKADMGIARRCAMMVRNETRRKQFWSAIAEEHERSRRAVLAINGAAELLDGVPWLRRSIEVRNPSVDPLNFVQTELLTRLRARGDSDDPESERLRQLARLSIQGVSGGLRTTG